ncbi:glycerophosphodiester phosphodiesterase family protein [Gynurincola endophyticus]|uniref:glycerophosphodiester phosphodiesterase family protein n=1 Tax=Gynurincola endophyticus TaxID=2479004 RepID=UPI000F8C6417|nr:glycerophosphodiester phosphodiesterase family protein [Gynurincola endophyticus]
MRKNIFLLIAFICGIVLNVSAQQKDPERIKQLNEKLVNANSDKVMIAAHRGAHLNAPENSLLSFQHAIDMEIDIVELDVRCTKDHQLVVIHDKTVDRTTNGKGNVDSFTFDEIRKLKLTHKGQLTDQQIPTLEEALLLMKGKILIDLDIKSAICIDKIIQTVKETGSISSCIVFTGDPKHVEMLKKDNKEFKTLLRTHSEAEVKKYLNEVKPEAAHLDESHYTRAVSEFVKSKGTRVWMNALGKVDEKVTKGKVEAFDELLKNGANIIQTDQPELLKKRLIYLGRY